LIEGIARGILHDKDAYIIGGILLREEIDLIEVIRECAERISSMVKGNDYVGVIAYLDLLYEKIRIAIDTIAEFRTFSGMRFVNYTIRADASSAVGAC